MLPISLALSRRASRSFPVAPETAPTWLMAVSKSAAVFTATVPSPTMGVVTLLVRVVPTPEILSPKFFKSSPTAAIFCTATADWFACCSRLFNFSSVSMISRCKPSYCSCVISPFASASFACSAAAFRVSSFSFVSATACARSLCFCASSSVLPGSSFRRLFTSRSCDCVVRMSVLTDFKAVVSFVVSPPISTVIPCILDAPTKAPPHNEKRKPKGPLKKGIKKDTCCYGKCLCKNIQL